MSKTVLRRPPTPVGIIAATRSTFGWDKLYVECICLFVDAQAMQQTLFERVRSQQTPTIIVTGKFMSTCDQEIDVLLNPPDLTTAVSPR